MESANYYEILGITSDFPCEAIEGLRRTLSKIYHPDGGSSPDAERMAQVNRACDVLRDPEARTGYDRSLRNDSSPTPPEQSREPPKRREASDEAWPPARPDTRAPGRGPMPPIVPTAVFVKQTKWLTPPAGGQDVFVAVTPRAILIYRVRGLSRRTARGPFTHVPLLNISGAARYDGFRSEGRVKFIATGGIYRFIDGWDDLVPAVRAQIISAGRLVIDDGADSWKVAH